MLKGKLLKTEISNFGKQKFLKYYIINFTSAARSASLSA